MRTISQINKKEKKKRFFFWGFAAAWVTLLNYYIFIMLLLSFVIDATFSVASDCQRCIDKREREALKLIPLCFTVVVIQRLASRARGSAYAKLKREGKGGGAKGTT